MEKRKFGRTNHMSTVAIYGAAALYDGTPEMAEKAMEYILDAGVNHIDIAPGYGKAEELMGPWIEKTRGKFFLGCKTQLRTKKEAATELRLSLEKLRTDKFDLHQLHAVTSFEELDQVTGSGGALEAIIEAKEEGLTDEMIGAVQSIVMAVSSGRVNAQLREVEGRIRKRERERE